MIYLYSGTPGSGKSLHQAENIYWRLRRNKPVVANYQINLSKIRGYKDSFYYLDNTELTPQVLMKISRKLFPHGRPREGSIQLYIDEAQLLFNAREWNAAGRRDWLTFFTEHRKYGYDIFLIAQFDRMLDRQIRGVIEYEVKHRKVTNFGSLGILLKLLSFGDLFVSVTLWYSMKERINAHFFRFHRRYARLYDTYKVFDRSDQQQTPAHQQQPVLSDRGGYRPKRLANGTK